MLAAYSPGLSHAEKVRHLHHFLNQALTGLVYYFLILSLFFWLIKFFVKYFTQIMVNAKICHIKSTNAVP